MLEILGIIMLCNKNKANAIARGRRPGGFIALTIGLWLGMEFIGAFIGFSAGLELETYVLALACAGLGGLISYLIAKNCKTGDYVPQVLTIMENITKYAQPLSIPAQVCIVREGSMVGAIVSWSFTLNGYPIGSLANGKSMTIPTNQKQNILRATDAYGTEIAPFVFDMESGGAAEIHFKANKFLPARSTGILPATTPVLQAGKPESGERGIFCHNCGSTFEEDDEYCANCGTKRFIADQFNAAVPSMQPVAAAPREAAPALSANPMRAVWTAVFLLGGWLLIFLLHCIPKLGLLYCSEASYLIEDAILGIGVYLLLQHKLKYKLFSAGMFVMSILLTVFNTAVVQMNVASLGRIQLSKLFLPQIFRQVLGSATLTTIVIAGLAMGLAYLLRYKPEKSRTILTGWATAGGALVYNVISLSVRMGATLGKIGFQNLFSIYFGNIISAVTIGIAIMAMVGLCNQKSKSIRLSGWGLVWCILCSLGMFSSIFIVLAADIAYSVQLVFCVIALAGFVLLLCGKRTGFFMVLFAAFIYLAGQFQASFTALVLYGQLRYMALFIGSILGTLNPVITWFSIRRAWMDNNNILSYPIPAALAQQ